jgi:anti-sigma B factor antagonist
VSRLGYPGPAGINVGGPEVRTRSFPCAILRAASADTATNLTDADHTTTPPVHEIERISDGVPAGTVLVALAGELDLSSGADLRAEVDAAAQEGASRLVLDLSDTEFMDSSMLKELLRANAELSGAGAQVVLVAPRPPVARLLELTRTAELFTIAPDRSSALG